jgi:predicted ATP-grasp superfamily ATP-dependent carboligase
MRILVTDGNTRSALAAVRSLGRAGHTVFVAAAAQPSLAGVSRYTAGLDEYPDPNHEAAAFMPALADIVRRRDIDVLLPMTEITTLLVTGEQQALPASCRLPFPAVEVVDRASDKSQVLALAQELGIPTPNSVVLRAPVDAAAFDGSLGWPVVVKPARSRVRRGTGWFSTSVAYAADAAALRNHLDSLAPEAYPVLLQERIEGPGAGVFACFDRGRAVALFAHRRVREKPPSGGVSVLCESAPLDPTLAAQATKLLERLGWHGAAMVEFKRDNRDGTARLLEINGRFWGSLQLSIDAGIDFPVLAVELAAGRTPATPPPYRLGVRSRWLAGDFDALLMRLLRSRRSLNLPPAHPGRLRAVWDFLHFGGRDLRFEIERRDDLRPARFEWRRKLAGH